MRKPRYRLAALLVMISFLAPIFAPAALAVGPGVPDCPPPPTQKVATLTYNISVTGTHQTETDMGQAVETAMMKRDREFRGVVRMVYYEDTDYDVLADQFGPGVKRTPGTPDRMSPGTVGIIDSQGAAVDLSAGGGMADELQTRMLECQRKVGQAAIACQLAVAQSMAGKAKKTCDMTKPRDKNDPLCVGLNGGVQVKTPQAPVTPGKCIPGKKGVKTGPYEVWTAQGCKVQAFVRDQGELMLQSDNSSKLTPVRQVESGEGETKGEFGCDAMIIISKMDHTASLLIERSPITIMVKDTTGGHTIEYAQKTKTLPTDVGVSNSGARNPMNWSTVQWNKGPHKLGAVLPNTRMVNFNGGRSHFQGSWSQTGSNPPGIKDYVYGETRAGVKTKTLRADSTTKITWTFDADPKAHIVTN